MADVEWDEAKRLLTVQERGVDFEDAALIFDGEYVEAEDRRRDYGEIRIRALGEVEGECFLVVYTWRGTSRHIITAWKVDEDGQRRYRQLLARRA